MWLPILACLAFLWPGGESADGGSIRRVEPVPVIYTTDLFHPHGDMDDQVDLAVMYAIKGIALKAVILDNGKVQKKRPGRVAVSQLNFLTGKSVPVAVGLARKLRNPYDSGLSQPAEYQAGVRIILRILKTLKRKAVLVTVGSLRDVAAAFNRNPALFLKKVGRIFVFAGEASNKGFSETNVKMDRHAFTRIMASGLPVYWVPCFDGGRWKNTGSASYWMTNYARLLNSVRPPILQYFIYAYTRSKENPLIFLGKPVDPVRKRALFKEKRNLWGAAAFLSVVDKGISLKPGYPVVALAQGERNDDLLFDFVPVAIRLDQRGNVSYERRPAGTEVMQFRVKDPRNYGEAMTIVTARLLSSL